MQGMPGFTNGDGLLGVYSCDTRNLKEYILIQSWTNRVSNRTDCYVLLHVLYSHRIVIQCSWTFYTARHPL